MKIGAIDLDYVKDIDKPKSRDTQLVWGAGLPGPIPFEDIAEPEKVTVTGTLVKNATFTKTLDSQIEDMLALAYLNAAYNSVSVPDLKGFLSISGVKPKVSAQKVGLRDVSLDAWLYPSAQYQRMFQRNPVILPNDFSFGLGVNNCDSMIALPVGASYSGGDGITITRAAEDGTITYMLATSAPNVRFDLSADEVNVGELKVWDNMNSAVESDWVRVFNVNHIFTGKQIIQNGLYRVIFDVANKYITIYYWSGAAYTKIDDFKSGAFSTVRFLTITPDLTSVELNSGVTVDMVRGHPPQIDTGNSDLLANSLTLTAQSTSGNNYLSLGTNLYICSNTNFSIIPGTNNLGKGKKWIYYETNAVIAGYIAHQEMVGGTIIRDLVIRSSDVAEQYGMTWNEYTDIYTRTGALQGLAVASSPGNALLPIQSKMRRCIVNDVGVVQYYLDPYDSTKKADGSASDLTGATGQVMVEIPAFYYRYLYAGTTHLWEISPVAKTGFTLHPAFVKNGINVSFRYVGAYEGILYDVSEARYTNGVYLTEASTVFTASSSSITQSDRTKPFARLQVGDKIVVSGTTSNNGTFTVSGIGDQSIIVTEVLQNETAASTVIQTQKNWIATTGDKLASVNAKAPINYGTRANFRAAAQNRGAGWRQLDYDLNSAIQLLYLVEYASFNSQSMIGAGLTDWLTGWPGYNDYNPINLTGLSNLKGNTTFNLSNGDGVVGSYMTYRGIENWYGHIWKYIDGLNINNNLPYVCSNALQFADDTITNYTALLASGLTLPNVDGWQNTLHKIGRGFLPASVGASSSTKISDYYWQSNGWRVALLGGVASGGVNAGAFCADLANASSGLSRVIGGRLAF